MTEKSDSILSVTVTWSLSVTFYSNEMQYMMAWYLIVD